MEQKINIFDAIGANKRNSFILIFFMGGILFAGIAVLGYIIGFGWLGFIIALVLTAIYIALAYSMGARTILAISGAREVGPNEEPFLRNVVEGLAMAANIPQPKIWIMEDPGMNAFATGTSPKNGHVVFTRGLINALKREELEGVAAHEISHIANYDIQFATLAVVMVGAIALIGDFSWRFIRFGALGRNRRGGGPVVFIIIIALLFAILGPIFAELVRFALSRQREYLADATGSKLTRYPAGLAGALEKISGHAKVQGATNATASLYIANPFEGGFSGFFATHPPIKERVARLRAM